MTKENISEKLLQHKRLVVNPENIVLDKPITKIGEFEVWKGKREKIERERGEGGGLVLTSMNRSKLKFLELRMSPSSLSLLKDKRTKKKGGRV